MAEDESPDSGFGSKDHLDKTEKATARIAENLKKAEQSTAKILQNLEKASKLSIGSVGGKAAPAQAQAKTGAGNTGVSTPTGAVGNAHVDSPAGDGASGMAGQANATVVYDTASDPGYLMRTQAKYNMGFAGLNMLAGVGIGAVNDLRVNAQETLDWERNLLIAKGGMGSWEGAKSAILGAANKYNVQDVDAFNRSVSLALNAGWGGGFGGGSTGVEQAANAMGGLQSLASAAGLTPDAAVSAGEALYSSDSYYTLMAAGIMTRDPATGEMLQPSDIVNQIYNRYGQGRTGDQIRDELKPGSGVWRMLEQASNGDAALFEIMKEGFVMAGDVGGFAPGTDLVAELEASGYMGSGNTEGSEGMFGFNLSEQRKIGEFAGVTGEGMNSMYGVLSGINDAMTAQGADSWLGKLHKIGGGLDVLATELPSASSAFMSAISQFLAAIPMLLSGMALSRAAGAGGPGASPAAGGGKLKTSAGGAVMRTGGAAVGFTATNMYANSQADSWGWEDAAVTIGGSAASGALFGSMFGLPGTIIGGLLGGGYGVVKSMNMSNQAKTDEEQRLLDVYDENYDDGFLPAPLAGGRGYSEGDWFVSKDEQANIHYGEMILPSRVAEAVRTEMAQGRSERSSIRSSPQVVINLSIQRATEREALGLARRVKGILESDEELYTLGNGRFS